jgi:hypothetical protein
MKFLRCGRHVVNPENIARYRGDGGSTTYGADGGEKVEHPRTTVVTTSGRVTFPCPPEVLEEYLKKAGVEVLEIPATAPKKKVAASDDDYDNDE